MIKPTARMHLSPDDVQFIATTLGKNRAGYEAVLSLLASESDRDAILDDPELFESITTQPAPANISLPLYFYVLIRHALRHFGMEKVDISDYLASMLAEFSKPGRAEMISESSQKEYRYLVDMLAALLEAANAEQEFEIQSHIGNYSMFLAGVFPDYIYKRATYGRPGPDVSYYEQVGSSGYQHASRSRAAEKFNLSEIFSVLASHFSEIRRALNYMADQYMHLDRQPNSMDKMMRRVQDYIASNRMRFS